MTLARGSASPEAPGRDATHIEAVLFAPGHGAYFTDDQAAIKAGATRNGVLYAGSPCTPGFDAIRMPARSLGIGLRLSDGAVVWGDMMSVQYAGAGGREPPLCPNALVRQLQSELVPRLVGRRVGGFRPLARLLAETEGRNEPLPNSALYGATQALLAAAAWMQRCTMAEIVCTEYGFPVEVTPVPIYGQCGEERQANVDKMILRRTDILPHGLINTPALVGPSAERFSEYARWVRDRIVEIGGSDHRPILHFDVYGGVGAAFGNDCARIAEFLCQLESALYPYKLQIEAPADFGSRVAQVAGFAELRAMLAARGSGVRLVADEWCNTLADVEAFVEAEAADLIQLKMPDMGSLDDTVRGIQACRAGGVGVYLGGSCTETDISARVSVHLGVATQVDMLLAKPGMGVDEGHMIVANEQARLLAMLRQDHPIAD